MLRLLIQDIPFACTQIKLQEFLVDLIPFLAPPLSVRSHCDNVIHKGPEISSNLLTGRDKSNKFHLKQGL